jgi:hypothetical protein
MSDVEEEVEEEIVEEEGKEKRKANAEVVIDIGDEMAKEALNDVLAINDEIPKGPIVKSEELREFMEFKEECDSLMELLKQYMPEEQIDDIMSENFDLRTAMRMAAKMAGLTRHEEEELLDGEPSPYVQELFKKIRQKYIDCKWFYMVMKGKKPITPRDLKFQKAPEDLIKAEGEKI